MTTARERHARTHIALVETGSYRHVKKDTACDVKRRRSFDLVPLPPRPQPPRSRRRAARGRPPPDPPANVCATPVEAAPSRFALEEIVIPERARISGVGRSKGFATVPPRRGPSTGAEKSHRRPTARLRSQSTPGAASTSSSRRGTARIPVEVSSAAHYDPSARWRQRRARVAYLYRLAGASRTREATRVAEELFHRDRQCHRALLIIALIAFAGRAGLRIALERGTHSLRIAEAEDRRL